MAQTGPNAALGGRQSGFSKVGYQELTDSFEKYAPNAAAPKLAARNPPSARTERPDMRAPLDHYETSRLSAVAHSSQVALDPRWMGIAGSGCRRARPN